MIMAITVKVNDLTLTHKGSGGMSVATIPDVCLTPAPPGPPAPVPYGNIAFSSDLVKGTTTVSADGGNMIAIQGSQFCKSIGDEPGINGGVLSGVNMKETNWITYSMDVFMDGKNACRLTDKQFHNHYNTVNMSGQLEELIQAHAGFLRHIMDLCWFLCECKARPDVVRGGAKRFQKCVDGLIQDARQLIKDAIGLDHVIYPEQTYVKTKSVTGQRHWKHSSQTKVPKEAGSIRKPDAIIVKDPTKPATPDNIDRLVEMKFQNEKTGYKDRYTLLHQLQDIEIAGTPAKVIVLTDYTCGCGTKWDPKGDVSHPLESVPEGDYSKDKNLYQPTNPHKIPSNIPD